MSPSKKQLFLRFRTRLFLPSLCLASFVLLGSHSGLFAQTSAESDGKQSTSDDAREDKSQTNDGDKSAEETREKKADDEADAVSHLLGMSITESPDEAGVVIVTDVDPLEPAWDAGIRPGDRLVKVQGVPTKPYDRFIKTMRELVLETKKGERIPVVVQRDGKKANLQITQRSTKKTDVKAAIERKEREERMKEEGLFDPNRAASADASVKGDSSSRASGAATGPVDDAGVPLNRPNTLLGEGGDLIVGTAGGLNGTRQAPARDGAALTGTGQSNLMESAELRRLRRLNRMRMEGTWTDRQEQEFQELLGRYAGAGSDFEPLSREDERTLDSLQQQQATGRDLSSEQQRQLADLQRRREESLFGGPEARFLAERDLLEAALLEGNLTPAEQNRLTQLRDIDARLGLSATRQFSEEGIFGAGSTNGVPGSPNSDFNSSLGEQQAQRFRELMGRGDQLTQTEANELQQLQRRAAFMGQRQQRNEFRSLRRQARSQTGLTRAQQQRLGNLRQLQIDQLNRINLATGGRLSDLQQAQQAAQQRAQSGLSTGPGIPATAGPGIGQGSGIGLPNGGANNNNSGGSGSGGNSGSGSGGSGGSGQ